MQLKDKFVAALRMEIKDPVQIWKLSSSNRINSQSSEDTQVGYISQKYTLEKIDFKKTLWNFLKMLKFWNLVKIEKFWNLVKILKFGQNFEIWS